MMGPPADAALVERLRRGERGAFRELYARFAQPTFGFLLRLAGRRDAAEDLHQEVWLSVARHAARLQPVSVFGAWFFSVARNCFRSLWRWPRPIPLYVAALDLRLASSPLDDPGCRYLLRARAALPYTH